MKGDLGYQVRSTSTIKSLVNKLKDLPIGGILVPIEVLFVDPSDNLVL